MYEIWYMTNALPKRWLKTFNKRGDEMYYRKDSNKYKNKNSGVSLNGRGGPKYRGLENNENGGTAETIGGSSCLSRRR